MGELTKHTVEKAAVFPVKTAEDLIVSPVEAVMEDLVMYPNKTVEMEALVSLYEITVVNLVNL